MKLHVSKIKDLMDKAKMDIDKLAALVPCTSTALYIAFKKERTKIQTIERIAAIFGVNPKDLLI